MAIVTVKDKVVIITGAGRGLGQAYAEALAGDGAKVVIAEINAPNGKAVAKGIKENGGEAIFVQTDVTDYEQCLDMVETTAQTYGRVDAIINNAAVYYETEGRPFFMITEDEWNRHMEVDVKGTFNCCRAVIPQMMRQGKGHIINIGSTIAMQGQGLLLDYCTAKGAIIALTKCLAKEIPVLTEAEITINCVCPGFTYTEATVRKFKGTEMAIVLIEALRTIKRKQMPSDVVGIIAFLVSDASDYHTGGVFPVDGGTYLH